MENNAFQKPSEVNEICSITAVSLSAVSDIMLQINKSGAILEFECRDKNDLIISPDEIAGKTLHDLMPAAVAEAVIRFAEKALQTGNQGLFEQQLLISTQNNHYETQFIANANDKVLIIVRNVTEQKNTQNRIRHISYHDPLTNLPNRYLLRDRLAQAIANAERRSRLLAVVVLDLDNFKKINATIGHTIGDKLLQAFAARLSGCVRQADSVSRLPLEAESSVVARLGGDEFTILLSEIDNIQDPAKFCNRVLGMLSEPFILGVHEVFVTVSIGIAVYPFDGKDMDSIIKNADVAMYQAKNQGRNNYQYYSESLNVFSLEKLSIENKLRKALDHNEFMLFYQPQIDITTGELIGVEALIRWLQPDLILIKPGEFIPMAEESGLIVPIGEWALRTACEQNMAWQKAGIKPMSMTVNVSSIQFGQKNFVEVVSGVLIETGLQPACLQLEITEGTLMKHSGDSIRKLHSLRDLGIHISLDDFGTGYSSLSYLKRFPLSTLKIDKSFIQDLATNNDDQSITKTIIDIANNFHLQVIAEGVETTEQLSLLKAYGCKAIQGHLICPAVNPISLTQFIKKYHCHTVLRKLSSNKAEKGDIKSGIKG